MAEVAITVRLGRLPPDDLEVLQARLVTAGLEAGTAHCGTYSLVARLGPAQVDQPVLGVRRPRQYVAEPALPGVDHRRRALDLDPLAAVGVTQVQGAAALGDEQVAAARQECHRPGLVELVDLLHRERPALVAGARRRPKVSGGGSVCGASRGDRGEDSGNGDGH